MKLIKTIRKIQYQTAKLEVVEFLFQLGKNNQPSLEVDLAHNMFSTLRQNLFSTSEGCFDAPLDTIQSHVSSLQNTLSSTINILSQIVGSSSSTDSGTLALKGLLADIISELSSLNTELGDTVTQTSQRPSIVVSQPEDLRYQINLSVLVDPNSDSSVVDQRFKHLISKCMGDVQQAERLIQYEYQRDPSLNRQGAIRAAIARWERDNQ